MFSLKNSCQMITYFFEKTLCKQGNINAILIQIYVVLPISTVINNMLQILNDFTGSCFLRVPTKNHFHVKNIEELIEMQQLFNIK